MTESMIERVAAAINESFTGGLRGDWNEQSEANKEEWRDVARAAIEAMREPTKKMISSGAEEGDWAEGAFSDSEQSAHDRAYARRVYVAMIDAALK